MSERLNLNLEYLQAKLSKYLESEKLDDICIFGKELLTYAGKIKNIIFFDNSDFSNDGTKLDSGTSAIEIANKILNKDESCVGILENEIRCLETAWVHIENDDYDDDYSILTVENLADADCDLTDEQKEWVLNNIDSNYWPEEWMEELEENDDEEE